MTVWSHLPTILKWRSALHKAGIIAVCVAFITTLFLSGVASADQNVTQVMNFQGRLLNQSGGLVPDGTYNIQFKIYQDTSHVWTETYVNANSGSGIAVKNGYFSAKLGSITAFGNSVDWSRDDLYLSINVAGKANDCTTFGTSPCVADGEMTPRTHIDAVPIAVYAKNAGTLNNLSSDKFLQLAQGVQTDATSNTSSIFVNKTASGNLIQLQNTAVDVFTVDNGGNIMMGSNSDHSIGIAGSTGATPGRSLTVSAGAGGGSSGAYGGNLILQGGAAGGSSENGGSVVINAGAKTGAGINGSISIGTTNTSSVTIGNASTDMPITIRGNTTVANAADSTDVFSVKTSLNNKVLTVDSVNARVAIGSVGGGTPTLDGYGLEIQGALRLSGGSASGMTDVYTTPIGSNVHTKINIPSYNPGQYSQILALGLPSSADATSRVMSLFDARTGAHQPTIGVFSPDENNLIGFSWDGSNSIATVKNTGNSIALQGNGLNLITATNNGGAANVGIGNNASSGYALDVTSTGPQGILSLRSGTTQVMTIGNTGNITFGNDTSSSYRTISIAANTGSDRGRSLIVSAGAGGTSAGGYGGTLYLNGGNAGASGENGGNVMIDGGYGTGKSGALYLGTGTTNTVYIGTSNKATIIQGGLQANDIDTTSTNTALSIGTSYAQTITIGRASANTTNTLFGNTLVKAGSSNTTTTFQIQRADGTVMLAANSTDQTITFGDPASGNRTVISSSTGKVTKYGSARNTKKITLNAEYTGSVLDAGTGSNNTGTMTSSIDLTNRMNYYKWTTSQASNQSYDVVVQVPIPTDFDGWASSNPLAISTYTSNTTNGTITFEARDSSNAVQCNFVSVTPGSTSTWTTNTSACTLSSGTYTAGDYLTFRIRMQSPNGGDVRIGNINLSYLSKY